MNTPENTHQHTSRVPKSARKVLDALKELNHATAPAVMDWINQNPNSGKKLSLTSVYRALNQLVEQGIAKPLNFNDGQLRYELNSVTHHHHLICTGCDSVQVLEHCPLEATLEQLRGRFQVNYHNFEVFGLCQDCTPV